MYLCSNPAFAKMEGLSVTGSANDGAAATGRRCAGLGTAGWPLRTIRIQTPARILS